MENKGYLKRLSFKQTKHQSFLPTFQVPKRGGGYRTIVDCKTTINPHLATQPSTQPGQRQVIAWTQTQPYIVKRDLKDAYHGVPIHHDHQRHFGLYYKGKAYQWQGMIVGLQDAPSVFQRVNNTILHGLNHRTYLDDSFYGGKTFREALQQREQGDARHRQHAFRPNHLKSSGTDPEATIDILGYWRAGKFLYIPEDRIRKILHLVDEHKYHKAAQVLEYYNPIYPYCAAYKWWLQNPKSWNSQKRRLLEKNLWEAKMLAYHPPHEPVIVHVDSANSLTAAVVTNLSGMSLHHFSAKLQPSKSSTTQERRGMTAAKRGLRHILELFPLHTIYNDNKNLVAKDPTINWAPGTSNLADKYTRTVNPEATATCSTPLLSTDPWSPSPKSNAEPLKPGSTSSGQSKHDSRRTSYILSQSSDPPTHCPQHATPSEPWHTHYPTDKKPPDRARTKRPTRSGSLRSDILRSIELFCITFSQNFINSN